MPVFLPLFFAVAALPAVFLLSRLYGPVYPRGGPLDPAGMLLFVIETKDHGRANEVLSLVGA